MRKIRKLKEEAKKSGRNFAFGNTYAAGRENVPVPTRWTHEVVKDLAIKFLEWAKLPDSLSMGEFYGNNGFGYQAAIDFEVFEEWREARKIVKAIIGGRREKGALIGKLDSPMVRMTHGNYDIEHFKQLKELKASAQEVNTPTNYVLNLNYDPNKTD